MKLRLRFNCAIIALIAFLSACSGGGSIQSPTATVALPQTQGSRLHAQAVVNPPASGIYLGAWANFTGSSTPSIADIEANMHSLEGSVGHPLTAHLHYLDWNTLMGGPMSVQAILQGDINSNRAPIISWNCLDNYQGHNYTLVDIANGLADADINSIATTLSSMHDANGHPLPMMLRYFWEFNVNATPGGNNPNANHNGGCFTGAAPSYPTEFKNAWTHIYNIFQTVTGNTTPHPLISFVWNPSVNDAANTDIEIVAPHDYYPGNAYVDWIGLDGYNKQQETSINPPTWVPLGFTGIFSTSLGVYGTTTYGKPIMLGETGSCQVYVSPNDQASFLANMAQTLANYQTTAPYSYIKAVNYFDAPGNYVVQPSQVACDDILGTSGLSEFGTIANSTLFSPKIPMP